MNETQFSTCSSLTEGTRKLILRRYLSRHEHQQQAATSGGGIAGSPDVGFELMSGPIQMEDMADLASADCHSSSGAVSDGGVSKSLYVPTYFNFITRL